MKLLLKFLTILAVCAPMFSVNLSAQCPPVIGKRKDVHIVQPGETLYGIARLYNSTAEKLATANNLDMNAILKPCVMLSVAGVQQVVAKTTTTPDVPKSYSVAKVRTAAPVSYMPTKAIKHTAQQGESFESIAARYGYSPARLMAMNGMESVEAEFYVGQQLVVNDCNCKEKTAPSAADMAYQAEPAFDETPLAPRTDVPNSYGFAPQKTAEQAGVETVSNTAGSPNWGYFSTSNFTPLYHIVSQQNETPEWVGGLYGLSGYEVMMMNNLSSSAPFGIGQKLILEDRSQPKSNAYILQNGASAPDVSASTSYMPSTMNNDVAAAPQSYNTAPAAAAPASAEMVNTGSNMNAAENDMVREINLIRTNPRGYIRYIEEYISTLQREGDMGNSIQTSYELIDELRQTPVLSELQPATCLFTAARKHGNDQRQMGSTEHQGSDGSMPWDRVLRECPSMKDGNENLVGGPADIRRAVVLLLVDDGIEGRGHRRTLLNPEWRYVACHKMGTIGDMPSCWVQKFGY
jgi:LysM repeat protein/uncharacterized protein YkwD